MICPRWVSIKTSGITTRLPPGSRPSDVMTVSISATLRTRAAMGSTLSFRAAASSRVGIEHDCGSPDAGRDLREHLQPLARKCSFHVDEAGEIPARTGQARNEASADRVGDARKYDRDRPRRLLKRSGRRSRSCKDHIL